MPSTLSCHEELTSARPPLSVRGVPARKRGNNYRRNNKNLNQKTDHAAQPGVANGFITFGRRYHFIARPKAPIDLLVCGKGEC